MLRCGLGETKPLTLAKAEDRAMVCAVGIERLLYCWVLLEGESYLGG